MGIDYTIFLGAYAECKTHKVDTMTIKRTCENNKCKTYGDNVYDKNTIFCSFCGSKIKEIEFPSKEDAVDRHELSEEVFQNKIMTICGDGFHFWMEKNNKHIWISNQKDSKDHFSFDPHNCETILRPITADVIEEETAQFKKYFKKELAILNEKYGQENVEVKWGLIHIVN